MAKDPYKYYRVEAAELLDNLTRGVQELEHGAPDQGVVAGLLRLAHTLKGASQVVKQPAIAQVAHSVEDLLGPYRERAAPVPSDQTRAVLELLDQIGSKLAALDAPPPGPAGPDTPRPADPVETVRVELEEMDDLITSLTEAGADLTAVQHETESLRHARQLAAWLVQQIHAAASRDPAAKMQSIGDELIHALAASERRLTAAVERAEREFAQARERANRLRLLPVQAILPLLARAAREAASALGKPVEFETAGGEIRLDAQVLTVLRDALLHLVRNAVAHGIEEAPLRASAGKPPAGRIAVQVCRASGRVTVRCRDDGRGMDLAAIRRAAVAKGAISESQAGALELPQAIDLILKGGLSTSPVTRVSGRGIGLDAVRDAVARLKGEIRVDTAPGAGTTVEISVPVSLTSVAVLLVETAGVVAAIPLDSVRQTLHLPESQIARSATGDSIPYSGRALPFLNLSQALGRNAASPRREEGLMAVVLGAPAPEAAVGVQRLLGTSVILARSLPPLAAVSPVVAGAALDAEGSALAVLSAEQLIAAARRPHSGAQPPAAAARPPILVIDDSLTTRMVEQSVLESAGHRVECATSGEEALEKAHRNRYSLFLVDVEMPGMDGFQFVDRARNDPALRETPCILVTSRCSPEDRRRGQESGARAYVVKSEFDQSRFLETIRQLVE